MLSPAKLTSSNLEFTLSNGGIGEAGDIYTGLDRFGRLIETIWQTGSTMEVQSQYGRNRFGGVVWRNDAQAHAEGVPTQDNYYWYDGLYQVKEHQRGTLVGTYPNYTGITDTQQDENWVYDPTGNWDSYSSLSPANSQGRTQNEANEITEISATVGNLTPGYDAVGNMTTLPVDPGLSLSQTDLTWDGWNRLVSVKSGGTAVASYAYDGLTRRISKTNASETRQYYYNADWRVLEERVDGASVTVDRQYTWGLSGRWELVRRLRSTGGSSLNEVLYVLKDYLDPVAIADATGAVVERYSYDAFGGVSYLNASFGAISASAYDWNFLFHAEFLDTDANLYNYGYRYYSTPLGRWLSRDPIGDKSFLASRIVESDSETADTLGQESLQPAYLFSENNPIFMFDANGLVVVGIYGFGGTFLSPANVDFKKLVEAAGGRFFGRSQDGSIQNYIRNAHNNPQEPIVLVGYSRGGVKIIDIAVWVLKNIPCAPVYLVGIDPVTILGTGSLNVPGGVRAWTNFYQKNGGNTFGPFKLLRLEFNYLNGTPYSGRNGTNINLTGYRFPDGNLVVHGGMPAYVYTPALQAIKYYESR
jgi:RHS repeat-associated protein